LLVDDILTTGATCGEAARVLKQAGASMIAVAVLARGVGDGMLKGVRSASSVSGLGGQQEKRESGSDDG
jgi:orotate phosphoribosyltransferase